MLRAMRWIVCVALMLAAVPAFAQRPGGFGGGRGGFGGGFGGGGFGGGGTSSMYLLLGSPAVQEELALSAEQKTSVEGIVGEIREQSRSAMGDMQGFRDLSEEQRREQLAAMAKKRDETMAKIDSEYKPKLAAVLDDVQLDRLQQISWQLQGVSALRTPELATALNLSQEQKDKLDATSNEYREKMSAGMGGGGPGGPGGGGPGGFQERFAQMREMGEQRDAAMLAVLTSEQKTKYEELKGAAFDVSKLRPQGGPGGGGRGFGGGNRPEGTGRPARPDSN